MINHGPNRTEIQFNDMNIFLSYATPVAIHDIKLNKIFRTETKYSTTTTRHINKWINLIVEERGFPSIQLSPKSYGTMTEESLQFMWNIATRNKSIAKRVTPDGDMNWKEKSDSLIKSRIHDIMDE